MRLSLFVLIFAFAVPAFSQTIKGQVKVSPELEKSVAPNSVLFVIARPKGVKGGPPLAVLRLPGPKFPQSFEIGAANMMAGGEFKGEMSLTAKLSKTGNAMTSSGDLLGESKKDAAPGAKDVEVVLNKAAP